MKVGLGREGGTGGSSELLLSRCYDRHGCGLSLGSETKWLASLSDS